MAFDFYAVNEVEVFTDDENPDELEIEMMVVPQSTSITSANSKS